MHDTVVYLERPSYLQVQHETLLFFQPLMPFKHFSPEDLSGFLTKRQRKGQARKDSVPPKVITAPQFSDEEGQGIFDSTEP